MDPSSTSEGGTSAEGVDDLKDSSTIQASRKYRRLLPKLLYLPYFLGIAWTCLHPVVSVLTGESKCRGWYLDEHSIEIKFVERANTGAEPSHLKVSLPKTPQRRNNFCDGNATQNKVKLNYSCYEHGNMFSLATIIPLSNAIDPIEEAIVVVVPQPPDGDWTTSRFHYTLLTSLENLADPVATPWLAKTVMVVAPKDNVSLQDATASFLDAYWGVDAPVGSEEEKQPLPPLPPNLSRAMLRSLIVLDIHDNSKQGNVSKGTVIPKDLLGKTEFYILPQGRRGALPNLDLVFLMSKLFYRASFLSKNKYPNSKFLTHSYPEESKKVSDFLSSKNTTASSWDISTKTWSQSLADMGLFAYNMAMGPYPPHGTALERGIDSVTIRASFDGVYYRDPAIETVQYMEYIIRALSNLHERLHHSHTFYWLPSPYTFVSHMEYFLPNILILLPLAVRGLGPALFEIEQLDLTVIGADILLTLTVVGLSTVVFELVKDDIHLSNSWLLVAYAILLIFWRGWILSRRQDVEPGVTKTRTLQSLQFVACVMAAYILVTVAFAHTALSYIASLIWTPIVAFRDLSKVSLLGKVFGAALLVATAPPTWLIPHIFPTYTPFVQFAYIPLHINFFLLVVSSIIG